MVVGFGWEAGASRTLTSISYNGVGATVVITIDASTTGQTIAYIDDASLPVDTPTTHTLQAVLSDIGAGLILGSMTYRNVAQGAPTDSDSQTAANPSSKTLTGLTAGALVVGGMSSNVLATFSWDNGEQERFDQDPPTHGMGYAMADIVGIVGTSQTVGATASDGGGAERFICAGWNKA